MPTFALSIWPIVAMAIFVALGPQRGLIWSVLLGYLFLPDSYWLNFSGLPDYGKSSAISLGVLFGIFITRSKLPPPGPADPKVKRLFTILLILLFVSPFVTTFANTSPVFFGPKMREGMTLWDVQSYNIGLLYTLVPWYFARRYLTTPEAHVALLKAMVLIGLCYSLLTLFELRMSPQLNNMLYGYFPHHWIQHLRGGGFRPLVFLDHGLSLGFFLMSTVVAAVALVRAYDKEKRAFFIITAVWLGLVLALSRNLGALALGLIFVPFALMASRRMQVRIAMFVAVLFLLNPLVRDVYVQPLLGISKAISQDRYGSLQFRFRNEKALLNHINKRPVAGWGTWSRWRVHNEFGRDITVSDGSWIIVLGKWGWLGYIGFFGMLILPIMLLGRAARRREISPATSGLALITAANLIYLIPNSTLSPIAWLGVGALAGFVQFATTAKSPTPDSPQGASEPRAPKGPVYTRFGPGTTGRSATTRKQN